MIEKLLYGPIEILPSTTVSMATLEIDGVKASNQPYTTYVFLDEVHGTEIEKLITAYNFASHFSIDGVSAETVRLDITQALNTALEIRPNFHITFLTRYEGTGREGTGNPVFGFNKLDIQHTHDMHPDEEHLAGVVGH